MTRIDPVGPYYLAGFSAGGIVAWEMARQLAGQEVTGRELQQVAERVYGGRMDWFFDQWFRGLGLPEYSIEWKQRATEDGKWLIEGKVRQRTVVGLKKHEVDGVFFRGKVLLTVSFGGGRESAVPLLVEGEVTPFKFKMPEEAQSVVLNQGQEMLALDVIQGAAPR
jgi:aminopeptidase N